MGLLNQLEQLILQELSKSQILKESVQIQLEEYMNIWLGNT